MNRPYAGHTKDELLKQKKEFEHVGFKVAEINAELKQRELEDNIQKLTKPHWTLTPTFWLVLVTSVLTLISTVILIFQFWQSFSQEKKSDLNKLPEQTNSQGQKPTEVQQKQVSQQKPVQKKP